MERESGSMMLGVMFFVAALKLRAASDGRRKALVVNAKAADRQIGKSMVLSGVQYDGFLML